MAVKSNVVVVRTRTVDVLPHDFAGPTTHTFTTAMADGTRTRIERCETSSFADGKGEQTPPPTSASTAPAWAADKPVRVAIPCVDRSSEKKLLK